MTTNPTPTDQITAAMPDIEYLLENTDCPRLPEWCSIYVDDDYGIVRIDCTDQIALNPPAVLAVIAGWVMEVCYWWQDSMAKSVQVNPFFDKYDEGGKWFVHCEDRNAKRSWFDMDNNLYPTYTKATLALLSAIVAALKEQHNTGDAGEGEGNG